MERPVDKAKPDGAETADANTPASRWKPHVSLSTLFSVAAVALSIISLYFSYTTSIDSAQVEAIKTEYGLFTDLGRTQFDHPLMAHLFAYTPEQYQINAQKVAQYSQALQPQDRLKYLLEEQGIANYFFTLFEETYFYWVHAKKSGNKTRAELLDGDMDYFSQQMCNPRLAWYWDTKKGMRMAYNFASALQKYVEQQMKARSCVSQDAKGPFG